MTIDLPLPEGGFSRFTLTSSDVLPAGLASKFPQLVSLKGSDDTGRTVRLDTAHGQLHALVADRDGSWLVQPVSTVIDSSVTGRNGKNDDTYVVYRRKEAAPGSSRFTEGDTPALSRNIQPQALDGARTARGGTPVLRTYRIAMTASGSYTQKLGGTKENGMAGIVRTVNRLNQVFETDLGIHFVLAENNDKLVFTPSKDPFARIYDDVDMFRENVQIVHRELGTKGFDVGHLLDAKSDAGVVGTLGNTCVNYDPGKVDEDVTKAAGMTGSKRPLGDAFHIDFVAHELGHQFGAHHSFSGCHAGSNNNAHRFAPGTGSTIMGYAGLCGEQNLQQNSDAYFHAASIDQIQKWTASIGGSCATTRVNPGHAPWIDPESLPERMVVPARTPFRLTAQAGFADPEARLTYTWEQLDPGPFREESILTDIGEGALFRSRPPTPDGEQTFPAMGVLLGDEPMGVGDGLPTTTRDLNFRLSVRDNLDHRSHVVTADQRVRVVDTGEAFEVLSPKPFATLKKGKSHTIRWRVARTNKAPILCRTATVHLSLDGGRTFLETPLIEETANTGKASFNMPDDARETTQARLRVMCGNGSFFALSPGDFTIRH
ncbi:reprolysin-like metallopeptidase [Luteibacter rhizovicinus]|nr:zinc-dependent metalloprotease family protein [Luteibacter rhizovicinus]